MYITCSLCSLNINIYFLNEQWSHKYERLPKSVYVRQLPRPHLMSNLRAAQNHGFAQVLEHER